MAGQSPRKIDYRELKRNRIVNEKLNYEAKNRPAGGEITACGLLFDYFIHIFGCYPQDEV